MFQVVALVSVKYCAVFEQSPLLSLAVISVSPGPNVVIATYIPGKYAESGFFPHCPHYVTTSSSYIQFRLLYSIKIK